MLRASHVIEIFEINGKLKSAEDLGHSKIFSTKIIIFNIDRYKLYINDDLIIINIKVFWNINIKNIEMKKIQRIKIFRIVDFLKDEGLSLSESNSEN